MWAMLTSMMVHRASLTASPGWKEPVKCDAVIYGFTVDSALNKGGIGGDVILWQNSNQVAFISEDHYMSIEKCFKKESIISFCLGVKNMNIFFVIWKSDNLGCVNLLFQVQNWPYWDNPRRPDNIWKTSSAESERLHDLFETQERQEPSNPSRNSDHPLLCTILELYLDFWDAISVRSKSSQDQELKKIYYCHVYSWYCTKKI